MIKYWLKGRQTPLPRHDITGSACTGEADHNPADNLIININGIKIAAELEHRPTLTFACTSLTWSLKFNRDSRKWHWQSSRSQVKLSRSTVTYTKLPEKILSALSSKAVFTLGLLLLTSDKFFTHSTSLGFFFICLGHKCQNSASSRKPALALVAEMNHWAHRVRPRVLIFLRLWRRSYLADRWMGRLSIHWRGSQRSLSCRETGRGE